MPQHTDIDVEYMQPVIAASKRREARFAPILLFACGLFMVCFIIWAKFSMIDEVTRGEGQVIPSNQIQRISHLEGGIIKDILIREGDIVQKDQILLRIDNTMADARVQENTEMYYRYLAAVARLKAQINQTPYVMPSIVEEKAPKIAEQEIARYTARTEKLKNELSLASQEIEQKTQELSELTNKREQLTEQYRLSQEEVAISKPLVEKGLSPKVDFLRLQREEAEIKGQLGSINASVKKAESTIKEAQDKYSQVSFAMRSEDYTELRDAENKLASAHGEVKTVEDRLTRTEIKSPVKGIIKQLLKATIGGIVKPGEDVIEIVPIEEFLLIEAQVKPSDVAFLRPGLPASVKLTAYDFSIYGGLKAELTEISPDTIEDPDKQHMKFFRVRLRTLGNKLSKSKKELAIIPGMTATVDIITGKKSILDYLLKPILKVKQNAFSEH